MRCSRARSTISSFIGVFLCRTGFEYPFTPPTHVFGEHTKIAYNSIGGSFPRQERERSVILSRLKTATFHSVRDSRGADFPNETNRQTRVAPDSVSAIADLFDSDFIFKNVSLSIQKFQRRGYFVFQASPHKSQASASAVAKVLAEASLSSGRPFVLLPIGYAAGHDDRKFLSEIAKISGFEVLEELTIWEILFVIKCSDGFFGTSLHGIITAMAYSVPHFAIGNVEKLRSYLETWGQSPFNGMHNVADIPYLTSLAAQDHSELLSFLASRARSGALENMHNLIRCVK